MTPEDKIKTALGNTAINYLPYFSIILLLWNRALSMWDAAGFLF